MYRFTDTIEDYAGSSQLPAEALQINGVFIENVIEGYRTLYTSGREMIAPEINALELSKRHGQIYRSRRYPARVITVGFQLIAPTPEEFRERFNILNGILYAEEAQLIFADEADKCFYGTLSSFESPEPGRNNITGEFSFTCSDPFKYSVEELTAEPVNGVIRIPYTGTVEARPALQVDFPKYGKNGTCSYLAFRNSAGDTIQIGGVNTGDFAQDDTLANNLIYEFFSSAIDAMIYCADDIYCSDTLPCCLSTQWAVNDCVFMASEEVSASGSTTVTEEGPDGRLVASSYGSGEHFHGPAVSALLTEVTNFELAFQNYFEADIEEKGVFIATLNRIGNSETVLASLVMEKSEDRQSMDVLMVVNSDIRKKVTFNLPLSDASSRIAKEGSKIEFTVNGATYVIYDDSIEDVGIHKAGFLLGAYSSEETLTTNSLEWVRLTNDPGTFTLNDSVIADCRSASIKMNGVLRPALDVISNDWESFTLQPGINVIGTSYKATGTKIPKFKVKYREAYL